MTIKNQQTNEYNILSRIISLCNEVKVDIKFLSSIISSQSHGSTEGYMKEFADRVEPWILESVKVIKEATETFREEGNLKLPEPFTWAGSVSLFPIHNGPGTVIVQMILWSCFNQACHDSIMKCLNDALQGNNTLPQDTSSCSNGMLWIWLQSYAFCVKTSVHYSCKYMLTKANEDPVDGTLVNPLLSNSIFLEACFVTGTISRSAQFFTFIGTNPKPPSYYSAHKPFEATKKFLCYLKTRPKVSFKNPPTAMIGEGKFTNETHLTCDILTMMLKNKEFRNHFNIMKEIKIQPSVTPQKNMVITKKTSTVKNKEDLTLQPVHATPLTLQLATANKDGKRKKPLVVGEATLVIIRPKLLILSKLLKIDFTKGNIKIEAEVKKITKKSNKKSHVKFTGVLDDLKVAVLSRCVSKLLQIKSPPLLLGENVLLKIVSDALIRTGKHVNMKLDHDLLPLLIEHLSETLFQDVTVLTGISLKGYLIPTKEEHFWQTHFGDECDNINASLSQNGKQSSRAMKRNPCNGDIINNPRESKLTKRMKQDSVLPNAVEEEDSSLSKKVSIKKKKHAGLRKRRTLVWKNPLLKKRKTPLKAES